MICPTCKSEPVAEGRSRCFDCMEAEVQAINPPRFSATTMDKVDPGRFYKRHKDSDRGAIRYREMRKKGRR